MAPVNTSNELACELLVHFASQYAAGVQVLPPRPTKVRSRAALLQALRNGVLSTLRGLPPRSMRDASLTMAELEACHQVRLTGGCSL